MTVDQIAAARLGGVARHDRRVRPPRSYTSFVGRDTELAILTRLLRTPGTPLVTITGINGSGKTRLAAEAAHVVGSDMPGGAVLVTLTGVADDASIPTVVASALDIVVAPGQEPEAAITRELRYMPTLLVVDDIDAVAGAAHRLIDLVANSPETRLLGTAKGPLRQPGEHVVRLLPLITPDERGQTEDELLANPAVRLFADRASAVQYDFSLDRANVRTVAELCRRLDGLPLAIELAAARSAMLSPSAQVRLLARTSGLDLTAGSSRVAGARGPLREAIAISYGLVGSDEQQILRGMSVFEAPARLEAIRVVCVPDIAEDVFIDRLTTLVDVHLVEADISSEEPRYRLLPMIRAFAHEELAAADNATFLGRHTDYFIDYARSLAQIPEHRRIFALAADRTDIEGVLERLVSAGDVRRGSRLCGDLGEMWERYGWFPVEQGWVETLIAAWDADANADPDLRALVLSWWARLSLQHPAAADRASLISQRLQEAVALARDGRSAETLLLGLQGIVLSILVTNDFEAAAAAAAEGLEVARANANGPWLSRFETYVAMVSSRSGNHEPAEVLGRSALDRAHRTDDLAWIMPPAMMLTELASLQGQGPDSSIPTLEELLANARALGDVRGEGWVIARLSTKAMRRHDDAQALSWITEGLELGRRTGLWDAAGFAIVILAEVAFAQRDDAAVARLHGSIGRIMPMLPISIGPVHMATYREMIQTVQERSGAATFDRLAHAAGRLSWDDATLAALDYAHRLEGVLPEMASTKTFAIAVEAGDSSSTEASDSRLTKRERDVVELLATGATNNQIAEQLGLSTKTVMHHSVSIYAKLNVRGRAEATAWAFRNGIVAGADSES